MATDVKRRRTIEAAGAWMLAGIRYVGGMGLLLGAACRWTFRSLVTRKAHLPRGALARQMVRVGLKSLGIVLLVQGFIGVILTLQMAQPLADWRQQAQTANIIGVAGFRMLGPIITAVVLSGFAGASIAAELGTMAVSQEVEALEATALNPVRYLVVPRVLATVVMTVLLAVIADVTIAAGGYAAARFALGPDAWANYWQRMRGQLTYADFFGGLFQAAVFGLLISGIACHEGLKATGGAEGVGRATTMTVVYSIVAIVSAACVFSVIFHAFGF